MTMTEERPRGSTNTATFEKTGGDVVRLPRRTIDKLLVAIGLVAAIVFAAASAMLMWGSNARTTSTASSSRTSSSPTPTASARKAATTSCKYADEQVTTGAEAEAYQPASVPRRHRRRQDLRRDRRPGAAQAVVDARESGASEAEIAELQATATELKAQRDSLFRGETLRLLLSSYAWATVGAIAGIAAYVAFAGAAVLLVLVVAGVILAA